MRRAHDWLRQTILTVVDWFYPLFRRFMPQQTYRYAACGGFNTVLDIFLFFVSYNYVFHKEPIPVYGAIVITPHSILIFLPFYFPHCVLFKQVCGLAADGYCQAGIAHEIFHCSLWLYWPELYVPENSGGILWLVSNSGQDSDDCLCCHVQLPEPEKLHV